MGKQTLTGDLILITTTMLVFIITVGARLM
jgi:hypothetical protein